MLSSECVAEECFETDFVCANVVFMIEWCSPSTVMAARGGSAFGFFGVGGSCARFGGCVL